MDFHSFKACCFGANVARVVSDEVAASSDACSVFLFFFRTDGTNDAGIGDSATCGDFLFGDEVDGVGSFYPIANSLCQAAKFICAREKPFISIVRVSN